MGPESSIEEEKLLNQKLSEARDRGISDSGSQVLEGLLREFGDDLKTKIDYGKPADIELLRV